MNKYLEKVAAALKEPAHPEHLGIDLSKRDEKELYKWMTAVTLFSKPISRKIASQAAQSLYSAGIHGPDEALGAGWDQLVEILDDAKYARYDFSTATNLLEQAKHLKEKYGTLQNLLKERTPEQIRAEIQTFRGIGPLGSQLFVEGLNT